MLVMRHSVYVHEHDRIMYYGLLIKGEVEMAGYWVTFFALLPLMRRKIIRPKLSHLDRTLAWSIRAYAFSFVGNSGYSQADKILRLCVFFSIQFNH